MKKVLFAYTSKRGQVLKILKHMESVFGTDLQVDYANLTEKNNLNANGYDYIIVASSIYYGSYHKDMFKFTAKNKEILDKTPHTFVSVNLTARKIGKDIPEKSKYIQTFLKKSKWQPKEIVMFAGLLDYPSYNFIDKMMIKMVMTITKGITDTTKTVEYTNWNKISCFARLIKGRLLKG